MIPNKDIPGLLNAAYAGFNRALPGGELAPRVEDGKMKTFCNFFIHSIAKAIGYTEFDGLMANQMIELMKKPDSGWIQVDGTVAQEHANKGVLVIAARAAQGHGHVCLIVPGFLEKSGSWGESVPKCANVGKDVFFGKKVSFAFAAVEKCDYFAFSKMI